jgi:hypothetical protein
VELFDRAAAAGGQLLRVDRVPGPGAEAEALALLFTFDVGRILVSAVNGRLASHHLEAADDAPDGALDAMEEEPWWRLLGAPLGRADTSADGAQLRLTFQAAADRPRVVAIACEGERLRAALEPGH